MRAKLSYLLSIATVVWLAFVGLGWFGRRVFVEEQPERVDTRYSKGSFTRTAPEMVVHHAHRLVRDEGPRVVVVGSSNAMFALPAERLGKALPDHQVHNFSVPSSNLSMAADVVELVLSGDTTAKANTTIVLGVYFGLFREDRMQSRGRPNPLRLEMLRYGLYHETQHRFQPRLGFELTRALTWDFEVARRYSELFSGLWEEGRWDQKLLQAPRGKLLYREKSRPPNAEVKAISIRKRIDQLGSGHFLASEQFAVLEQLVERCREEGVRLVIVDLPAPQWSRKALYEHYREHWHQTLAELGELPGVYYLDMVDALSEQLMCDDAHALDPGAQLFTETLVSRLREEGVLP